MATRTAVVAGTATAVSGRVARRQDQKFAAKDQAAYDEQQAATAEQASPAEQAPAPPEDDSMAEIQKLAQMHEQGIITDEEFAAAKAKALGI